MATLFLPPSMRDLTGGARKIDVHAATVRELVDELESAYPGFREALIDTASDSLRSGLALAIDGVTTNDGLLAAIPTGAEVHILPAIGGG